jgi:hypothetical protein
MGCRGMSVSHYEHRSLGTWPTHLSFLNIYPFINSTIFALKILFYYSFILYSLLINAIVKICSILIAYTYSSIFFYFKKKLGPNLIYF